MTNAISKWRSFWQPILRWPPKCVKFRSAPISTKIDMKGFSHMTNVIVTKVIWKWHMENWTRGQNIICKLTLAIYHGVQNSIWHWFILILMCKLIAIKVLFFYFNLCLSVKLDILMFIYSNLFLGVKLDILSCSFTPISFLTTSCLVLYFNLCLNVMLDSLSFIINK